jgi:hypothetical protein
MAGQRGVAHALAEAGEFAGDATVPPMGLSFAIRTISITDLLRSLFEQRQPDECSQEGEENPAWVATTDRLHTGRFKYDCNRCRDELNGGIYVPTMSHTQLSALAVYLLTSTSARSLTISEQAARSSTDSTAESPGRSPRSISCWFRQL